MTIGDIPDSTLQRLRKGVAIPAHPLALTHDLKLDEIRQRALTRYYLDSGAGGMAVGVHTTQFEIRNPEHDLLEPLLKLASQTVDDWRDSKEPPIFKVAGICGKTNQAVREAEIALTCGYHAGLLSLSALREETIDQLILHCREVSKVMPVFGFYLQPSVGGRLLPYEFWRQFVEIENVIAIKIAAFNRYQTFEVIRALCESGRESEISLYTGNDDNIIIDLLTTYRIQTTAGEKTAHFVGGLLGHWAVWTKPAVEQLNQIHFLRQTNAPIPQSYPILANQVTDANAALFDVANQFKGCIPGIHEVLRRQGLLQSTRCLNSKEVLSPGQSNEITRIHQSYPHLNDDNFVQNNLDRWLT
ncbi:MAG TPA: dihydrodipicolinate synthase family protein [Verrucomicrobiales bacterium]|nr:dihydrodipicolinate synthase family protein [Verrucomicrobiales bacterium]